MLLEDYGIDYQRLWQIVKHIPGYSRDEDYQSLVSKAGLRRLEEQLTGGNANEKNAKKIIDWLNMNNNPDTLLHFLDTLRGEFDGGIIYAEISVMISAITAKTAKKGGKVLPPAPIVYVGKHLAKGDVVELGHAKVQLELFWGVIAAAKAASQPKFDVDYALIVCRQIVAHTFPENALVYSDRDIVYWPSPSNGHEERHVFPFGVPRHSAAIIRSDDNTTGGNEGEPDETGEIDFSRLPDDVVRIVVYVHIFQNEGEDRQMLIDGRRTRQKFKHANVRFHILDGISRSPIALMDLGQKHPENWGVVLGEFLKDAVKGWRFKFVEEVINGDNIENCLNEYHIRGAQFDI